jgi:DNA modification methylase
MNRGDISRYKEEVVRLGPYLLGPNDTPENGIYVGDARELGLAIPDNSVDLIFTDPVYQNIKDYEWLSCFAARVLKQGGDLIAYFAMYHLEQTLIALSKCLDYRWLIQLKKMSSGTLIWSYDLFSHLMPALWFTKGKPRTGLHRIDFFHGKPNGNINHKWAKNVAESERWLLRFSLPDDVIVEPFCGGGTTPVVCKRIGRQYVAFETDLEMVEKARERVRMTQSPLFTLEPEQMSLEL